MALVLKQLGAILAFGGALEIVWIASYCLGPLRGSTGSFLILLAAAVALFWWAFFRVEITPGAPVGAVLAFAALFRLTLLPAQPYQSEDVYRYIWDARVSSAGINPYRYPPDAPELEGLRDDAVYSRINSKPYLTVYPPLSQLLFRSSRALFGESVTGTKAVFCMFEFATVVTAWRLLVRFGQPLQGLLLIAWNPLFVFEFSHSGHSDSAMMFFALASILLLDCRRHRAAAAAYVLAVLSKLHPALWFPALLRRAGLGAALPGAALGLVLVGIYYTPTSLAGYARSLGLYYRLFEFNAGIHYLLHSIGRVVYHQAWDKLTGPYLVLALLVAAALIAWRLPIRDARDVLRAAFWVMTADLLLGTTVHPWYLSWAACALPFFPYAFMVYWTGAALLSYAAYGYRPVCEPAWVLLVEYLPMYGLMAWELARGGSLLRPWLERKPPA
ncbi:MAG: hypothetical protein DMG07_16270 [Acidobacteria bacterium]|nr:MAG: hypothetical protein DMG07_16270 [Acidobacteriota bacterium]